MAGPFALNQLSLHPRFDRCRFRNAQVITTVWETPHVQECSRRSWTPTVLPKKAYKSRGAAGQRVTRNQVAVLPMTRRAWDHRH
jgi:hypothetical protein